MAIDTRQIDQMLSELRAATALAQERPRIGRGGRA